VRRLSVRPFDREVRLDVFSIKRPETYSCNTLAINVCHGMPSSNARACISIGSGEDKRMLMRLSLVKVAVAAALNLDNSAFEGQVDLSPPFS